MNKQYKGPNSRGIEWTDYTWNPIAGCLHSCAWMMPDGKVANCYAEDVANRIAENAYPLGFEHHYWKPMLLAEPGRVKTPSKIFVGSMADVFGNWVPLEQIEAVLKVVADNPQHSFQFLTKNPKRLKWFYFPRNAWVGISAPPSHMWGKPLTWQQQRAWLDVSLRALMDCNATVKWMSIEPLSYDITEDLQIDEEAPGLHWAVIGAATNGAKVYQPDSAWVERLIDQLDCDGVPVFFKGNLKGNPAANPWREEFPIVSEASH